MLREERTAREEDAKRPREDEEVVGRETGTGVWADVDDDAAYEDAEATKKARQDGPAPGPLG